MSLAESLKRTVARLRPHREALLESWVQAMGIGPEAPAEGWRPFCAARLEALFVRLEAGELEELLEEEAAAAEESVRDAVSYNPFALAIRAFDGCCLPFLLASCPDKDSLGDALLALDELGNRRLEAVIQAHEEEAQRRVAEAEDQAAQAAERARELAHANAELARAQARAQRRADQIATLANVARQIAGVLDPETLLAEAAQAIQAGAGMRYVAVVVLDHEGVLVGRWAARSGVDRRGKGRMQGPAGGIIGRALRKRAPQVSADVELDPHYHPDVPGTRSEMVVPLLEEGEAIGALDFQSDQPGAFDLDDVAAAEAVADFVVIALRNARLVQDLRRSSQRN